jgi:hypothetical protein
MDKPLIVGGIDWQPVLSQLVKEHYILTYPGDLKATLIQHAGLSQHPQAEATYQLAIEISRLTTCCDPEVIYWFSRLVPLLASQQKSS